MNRRRSRCVATLGVIACFLYQLEKEKQRKIRERVRQMHKDRLINAFFEKNYMQMKNDDPEQFLMCTRMTVATFDILLELIKHKLEISMRKSILPECRLFLTLLYLSQGTSRQVLAAMFKMGVSAVRSIVLETCEIIWNELSKIYLSPPNTNDWAKIADDYKTIWNFPNCVGAIDAKHIEITCPPNMGSQFCNYKGRHSIVLMAVCDANYTFTYVDVGAYGRQSDVGIFRNSVLGKTLGRDAFNLPPAKLLQNSNISFPHFFVGNTAFPLSKYMLKPYPDRDISEEREYFNMRLSRVRRTIENAFGILTAKWNILGVTMNLAPEPAEKIVKCCLVLHNFIKMTDQSYIPDDFVDHVVGDTVIEGLWRKQVKPLCSVSNLGSHNATKSAFEMRNTFCDYINNNKI